MHLIMQEGQATFALLALQDAGWGTAFAGMPE